MLRRDTYTESQILTQSGGIEQWQGEMESGYGCHVFEEVAKWFTPQFQYIKSYLQAYKSCQTVLVFKNVKGIAAYHELPIFCGDHRAIIFEH
jgi:hypothetical protein